MSLNNSIFLRFWERSPNQINGSAWLKNYTITQELGKLNRFSFKSTTFIFSNFIFFSTSGSRLSIRMDYAPYLIEKIIKPLRDRGADGVEEALSVMKEYRLLREDIDSLIELTTWPGKKNPMDAIEGKVKAALTRAYNKEVTPYTYTATAAIKKKKMDKLDDALEAGYGGDEEEGVSVGSDDEEDENVESDVMIKAKKKPTSTKGSDGASTSKKSGGNSRKAKK